MTEPAHEPAEPTETTAAVTEPALEPETTAAPEPETTVAPEPPVEPASSGVYRASAEQVADGASIENTRLGQIFDLTNASWSNGAGNVVTGNTYHLAAAELRTVSDGPYALSVRATEYESYKLFVRSYGAESMFGNREGDGISVSVKNNGSSSRVEVCVSYNEQVASEPAYEFEIKCSRIEFDIGTDDIITIADDGSNVYVLVDETLYVKIDLGTSFLMNQSFLWSSLLQHQFGMMMQMS